MKGGEIHTLLVQRAWIKKLNLFNPKERKKMEEQLKEDLFAAKEVVSTTDARSLPLMTTHYFPKTIDIVTSKNIKLYLGPCKIVKTLAGKLCLVSPVYAAGYFGTFRPNGDFTPTKTFTVEMLQLLINVEERGLAAIKEIGLLTGNCCVCGRTLTAEGSIDSGIGPICAGKF